MLRSAGVGAATLTAKAESKSGRPMFGDRFSCLADSKSMTRVGVVSVRAWSAWFLRSRSQVANNSSALGATLRIVLVAVLLSRELETSGGCPARLHHQQRGN